MLYLLQKASYRGDACPATGEGPDCSYPIPHGCQRTASITSDTRPYCGAHSRSILTHGLGPVEAALDAIEGPARDRRILAQFHERYTGLSAADATTLPGLLLACRIKELQARVGEAPEA